MFSRMCGFSDQQLMGLEDKLRLSFEIKNGLIVLSLICMSAAAYYVISLTTGNTLISLLSSIFVATTLFFLQRLITTSSGVGIAYFDFSHNQWKPSSLRVLLFFIFSVLFSQPITLFIFNKTHSQEVIDYIDDQKQLRTEFTENSIREKESGLLAKISAENEIVNLLIHTNHANFNTSTLSDYNTQTKRKALLFGNQAYAISPLNNPNKDAQDLAKKLTQIGFKTTIIMDGSKSAMEVEIEKYLNSLQPGDISFFYFSGHGFQDHGNNYLVPTDFIDYNRSKAVGLNLIIESISRKHPLASIITIDACRSSPFGSNGGLATTEAGLNTYIALAAKPGQFANDGQPGTNGIFTAALLKHIGSTSDVDTVFRNVREDVAQATSDHQETWSSHNLNDKLILPAPEYIKTLVNDNNIQNIDQLPKPNTTSCEKTPSGLSTEATNQFILSCHQKKLLKLEDELATFRLDAHQLLEKSQSASAVSYSSLMVTCLYLNNHWLFLIIVSILTIGFLMLGFYLRENHHNELGIYEELCNHSYRDFTIKKYQEYSHLASLFKYAPSDDLRNSKFSPYRFTVSPEKEALDTGEIHKDFLFYLETKNPGDKL